MSAPKQQGKDWVLNVDFYEIDDFQVRFATHELALAQVEAWAKQGFVSEAVLRRDVAPVDVVAAHPEIQWAHRAIPITAVKEFSVRWHPAQ